MKFIRLVNLNETLSAIRGGDTLYVLQWKSTETGAVGNVIIGNVLVLFNGLKYITGYV